MTWKLVMETRNGVRYDPILDQNDHIPGHFFDPEWSLAPVDSFPGHSDPDVLRVYTANPSIIHNSWLLANGQPDLM